jgi:hypothetical protein
VTTTSGLARSRFSMAVCPSGQHATTSISDSACRAAASTSRNQVVVLHHHHPDHHRLPRTGTPTDGEGGTGALVLTEPAPRQPPFVDEQRPLPTRALWAWARSSTSIRWCTKVPSTAAGPATSATAVASRPDAPALGRGTGRPHPSAGGGSCARVRVWPTRGRDGGRDDALSCAMPPHRIHTGGTTTP